VTLLEYVPGCPAAKAAKNVALDIPMPMPILVSEREGGGGGRITVGGGAGARVEYSEHFDFSASLPTQTRSSMFAVVSSTIAFPLRPYPGAVSSNDLQASCAIFSGQYTSGPESLLALGMNIASAAVRPHTRFIASGM
jgi:hypothetical protein